MITIDPRVFLLLFQSFCSFIGNIDNPCKTNQINYQDSQLKKKEQDVNNCFQ